MSVERGWRGLGVVAATLLVWLLPGRAMAQATGHVVCDPVGTGYLGYLDSWDLSEWAPLCSPTGGCDHVSESVCYYFAGEPALGIMVTDEHGESRRCVLALCMPADLYAMSCTRPDVTGCPLFFDESFAVGCRSEFCLPAGDPDIVGPAIEASGGLLEVCPFTSESSCDPGADGDADSDVDSDSDGDGDADSDPDADSDVDADADTNGDADSDADPDLDGGIERDADLPGRLTLSGGGTFSCACRGADGRRVRRALLLLLAR